MKKSSNVPIGPTITGVRSRLAPVFADALRRARDKVTTRVTTKVGGDARLVQMGSGFCQLPVGSWQMDVRSEPDGQSSSSSPQVSMMAEGEPGVNRSAAGDVGRVF